MTIFRYQFEEKLKQSVLLQGGLLRSLRSLAITILLSACALGEDYVQPLFDFSSTWKETPIASVTLANAKMQIDKEWWKNFDDPILNDLIDKALDDNLDIKIALARIKEARATRLGVIAGQLPEINATGAARRNKNSQNSVNIGGSRPYNAFSLGFDAGWEADIFGGSRAIEAADATLQAAQENVHDVEVILLGDVASEYVSVRNYQNQIMVTEYNLKVQRDTLALTKSLANAGFVSNINVSQAKTLLQTTQSNIPTLRAAMRESLHSLEVLLGKQPGALEILMTKTSAVPISRHKVVMGAPVDLLRNRPDIRQAERQLAAATAIQGVALSQIYPKISLNSLLGLGSKQTSNLISGSSNTWSLGTGAILPILDFGRIRSDIDIADARQKQAFLTYQKIVISALKEVENALVVYTQEQERLALVTKSVKSQKNVATLIDMRYRDGLVAFQNVLDAKLLLYDAQIAQVQSRAALSTDLIVLYKALGGGWVIE
jgi:hypothetical protein